MTASSTTERPQSPEDVERHLRTGFARALGLEPEQIDPTKAFTAFGLDSIKAFALTGDLAEWLGRELPATLFWDYPNIDALTAYVVGELGLEE